MLKELATLISKLSYTDMMEWCESDAFANPYGPFEYQPRQLVEWARRELENTSEPQQTQERIK